MGRLIALLLAALAVYVAVVAMMDNARLAQAPDQVAIAQAQAQQAQAQAQAAEAAARIAQARAQEADAQARAEAARAEMWRGIVASVTGQVPTLLLGASHGALLAILALLVWRRAA